MIEGTSIRVQPLEGNLIENQSLSGNLIENQSLNGGLAQGTVKIFPKLIDLEVMPSTEIQTFNHEGEYGYDNVTINAIKVKEHYLEGTNLILVLDGDSKLSIDISEYMGENGELDELTVSKIEELIVSYFENKTIEEVER